jgi:hypothetical protein
LEAKGWAVNNIATAFGFEASEFAGGGADGDGRGVAEHTHEGRQECLKHGCPAVTEACVINELIVFINWQVLSEPSR